MNLPSDASVARIRDLTARLDLGHEINSHDEFASLKSECRRLLGANYDEAQRRHSNGLASQDAPSEPHRLMTVLALLDAEDAAGTPFDRLHDLLAELRFFVKVLRSWEDHPAWSGLQSSLTDSSNFGHHVALLSLASCMQKENPRLQLLEDTGENGKNADLVVFGPEESELNIEVKTPWMLRDRHALLTSASAEQCIKKTWRKASKQIGKVEPGALCVAGFNLPPQEVAELVAAARNQLNVGVRTPEGRHQAKLRPQLYGLLILNLYRNFDGPAGFPTTQFDTHYLYNDGYMGFKPKGPPANTRVNYGRGSVVSSTERV